MSERFVSGVSAKIGLYKYSSFPFPYIIRRSVVGCVRSASRLPRPPCSVHWLCADTNRSTEPGWCQPPPRRLCCEQSGAEEKLRQLAGNCWQTEPLVCCPRLRPGATTDFPDSADHRDGVDDRERSGYDPATAQSELARSRSCWTITEHISTKNQWRRQTWGTGARAPPGVCECTQILQPFKLWLCLSFCRVQL